MVIRAVSLQSGSNGNCLYVEAGGARLIFDAGIPGSRAEAGLRALGREVRDVDAVIISHDHADHVLKAGVFQRKFGLPLFFTPRTLEEALARHPLGKLRDVHYFLAGGTLAFGEARVRSIPTRHDGVDGAGFVVTAGGKSLGILTDLGHAFQGLGEVLSTLDGVFLESNYDPEMLRRGPYPRSLKRRIEGPGGHLSNREAAELLREYGKGLRWACLAHLSETNNALALALRTHRSILAPGLPLRVASRYAPTGVLTL
jgi:phosphoribosyl 1,2-cyclic phosphodiesterase